MPRRYHVRNLIALDGVDVASERMNIEIGAHRFQLSLTAQATGADVRILRKVVNAGESYRTEYVAWVFARGDGGDFFVGAAFEFAQDDNFAEMRGQVFESALQALAIVGGHGQRFRIFRFGRHGLFVELRHFLGYVILLQPGEAAIADNLQKPGARVAGLKSAEGAVGAQKGFLRDVFGLRAAAQNPTRQIVGGVAMRNDVRLKARPVCLL